MRSLYLYAGPGVCKDAFFHMHHTLHEEWQGLYRIETLRPHDVLAQKWQADAALFIMPGGADILYDRALRGAGNQVISSYVQQGGCYLGVCAGAYYAASSILFKPQKGPQIKARRELQFFPGQAIGPVGGIYDRSNYSGARLALLSLPEEEIPIPFFLNGGPYFDNSPESFIMARYDSHHPALLSIAYGLGHVILSGVHFEYHPARLNPHDPFLAPHLPSLHQAVPRQRRVIHKIWRHLRLA